MCIKLLLTYLFTYLVLGFMLRLGQELALGLRLKLGLVAAFYPIAAPQSAFYPGVYLVTLCKALDLNPLRTFPLNVLHAYLTSSHLVLHIYDTYLLEFDRDGISFFSCVYGPKFSITVIALEGLINIPIPR